MTIFSHWPSVRTAIGTLNVNGWLRRPREPKWSLQQVLRRETRPRGELRRVSVTRIVKKHHLDVLQLQETHLQDQEIIDSQHWWLRRHGFSARFNIQTTPADKGSTGILWRDAKWEHVSSEDIGPRFLLSQLRARAGGEVRFLAGHFSCEPNERRQQWHKVEAKLAPLPPLPLVILADHNSVMVPGSDTAVVSKEVPAVVRSRQVEGSILTSLAMEDVWVHLHGERRAESLEGFTFPSLQRRIDRVHLPTAVLNTVRSVYTVTTPSDHKVAVL